jgi:hypothetical protein
MSGESAIEDARGVDLGQIRQQRRMPVEERVRTMVATANVMLITQVPIYLGIIGLNFTG